MPVHTPKERTRWERKAVTVINTSDQHITEQWDGDTYEFPPKSYDDTIQQGTAALWFGDPADRVNVDDWNREVALIQARNERTWEYKRAGQFGVKNWGMVLPGGNGGDFYKVTLKPKEAVNQARPLAELLEDEEERKALAEMGLAPRLVEEPKAVPVAVSPVSPAVVKEILDDQQFDDDDYNAVLAESEDEDEAPKGKRGRR